MCHIHQHQFSKTKVCYLLTSLTSLISSVIIRNYFSNFALPEFCLLYFTENTAYSLSFVLFYFLVSLCHRLHISLCCWKQVCNHGYDLSPSEISSSFWTGEVECHAKRWNLCNYAITSWRWYILVEEGIW